MAWARHHLIFLSCCSTQFWDCFPSQQRAERMEGLAFSLPHSRWCQWQLAFILQYFPSRLFMVAGPWPLLIYAEWMLIQRWVTCERRWGTSKKGFGWRDSRRIFLRLFDTSGHCIHILAVCEDSLRKPWQALYHIPDATGLNFSP